MLKSYLSTFPSKERQIHMLSFRLAISHSTMLRKVARLTLLALIPFASCNNVLPPTLGSAGSKCAKDYEHFLSQITATSNNVSFWAWKSIYINFFSLTLIPCIVLDASGGFPTQGLLEGNSHSLGSYHSCLEVKEPHSDVKGKFCNVKALIPLGFLLDFIWTEASSSVGNPLGLNVIY